MSRPRIPRESSWFASRPGRHYLVELALLIAAKALLLVLLWLVFFARSPRADLDPDAIVRHLVSPLVEQRPNG
jgi:cation transporter-like permease